MKEILVLGLGNEILSDDAIGILAVREVQKIYQNNNKINFVESSESGIALLDYIIGYKKVLILDSILKEDEEPGTIEQIDLPHLEDKNYSPKSPHYIGLPFTIKIAQNLNLDLPETIKILAINIADPYTLGENITPAVKNTFPIYIGMACAIIEQWL